MVSNINDNWKEIIKIWEGLVNFRGVLRGFALEDIKNCDQGRMNILFPGYGFKLKPNSKNELLKVVDLELAESYLDENLRSDLESQKSELQRIKEDIVFNKRTNFFNYEFVLRYAEQEEMQGFVKISSLSNPNHRGLLSWSDSSNSVLFLAEIENDYMRFHINYGRNGLAVIEEEPDRYRWVHSPKSNYLELVGAEFGSVTMLKISKEFALEHGNLAAAVALSKAKTIGKNGKTLIENNIELMRLYRNELEKLVILDD